jgi:hypothetical protein
MRERITIAFVVLAMAVLLGAGTVRAYTLQDLLREQEGAHLSHDVALIAELIAERRSSGAPVDQAFLDELVSDTTRLEYAVPSGRTVVAEGEDYAGAAGGEDITASVSTDVGMITVSKEPRVIGDILRRDVGSLVTLFLLIGLIAGAAGWVAARALSSPFQKLALAAGALGRGRFDLELPRTRVPEARAIAKALETSALQLETRLSRERDFAEHASHELKTPLTALRLELEELTLRDDVPEDAKAAATRCIASVENVNRSASELVALTRRGSLVEGAELTLHELATQLAQRWADRLAEERRPLSASAEGDLEMAFTPGPVEHILDLVLSDIVLGGKGPVRITFLAEHDHLRIRMPAGVVANGSRRRRGPQPGAGIAEARQVAESQGGRVIGDGHQADLEILLPRR